MRRIFFGLALLSLGACNNAEQKQNAVSTELNTNTTSEKTNLLTNPEHGQPGHDCALPVGAPLKQNVNMQPTTTTAPAAPVVEVNETKPVNQSTTPASTNVKLNPAHGQPGHDCAIAVGAPLK